MPNEMYCPRCSNKFSNAEKFCRTCGLSLDGVVEIVEGETASEPEVRSRPNFGMMRAGVGFVILGLVIGLVNGALRSFELYPQEFGKIVFLTCVAIGMLCLGAGFIFPKKYFVKRPVPKKKDRSKKLDTDLLENELLPPAKEELINVFQRREPEAVPHRRAQRHRTHDSPTRKRPLNHQPPDAASFDTVFTMHYVNY